MTHRERLIGVMKHQKVDQVPDYEFGAWSETIQRWHQEGLPKEFDSDMGAISDYFNTDDKKMGPDLGYKPLMFPTFETIILEEKGDHVIIQDAEGKICEMLRPEIGQSIPKTLKYPIETRTDWKKIRDEKLDPHLPGRFPDDIDERCKQTQTSENPVFLFVGSYFGILRNYMGVENLSYAVYDEPEWVEEMLEHLMQINLVQLQRIAGKAKIDVSMWWEDICFKNGPLVNPKHFIAWAVPRYKKVNDFLRNECNCELSMVDCDGDISLLVPHWLECGVNVMWPLEAAHTDGYKLSEKFGTRLGLKGYFNKLALIQGKDAIDREFERLRPLFRKGGFIPHVDHLVPPDVSWDNYCYYRKKKLEFIHSE